jgi:hypothetical protein
MRFMHDCLYAFQAGRSRPSLAERSGREIVGGRKSWRARVWVVDARVEVQIRYEQSAVWAYKFKPFKALSFTEDTVTLHLKRKHAA